MQGTDIDRTIHLKPPPEANTEKLWLLRKCVYGLADAPRHFYLRLRDELINLKAIKSPADHGLFSWMKDAVLEGILVCHVDDMLWGGTECFIQEVIEPLRSVLSFSTENSVAFKYIGIEVHQHNDLSITVDQDNFTRSIPNVPIPNGVEKHTPLNPDQQTLLRSKLGQLNWLANVSRPEISFDVCFLSGKQKDATIEDLISINKLITKVKNNRSFLLYPSLDLNNSYIVVYADASFGSLPNGGSQGGQIVFLCDKYQRSSPIGWNSSRLRRVVRSALGAETLSFCDGCELAFYIAHSTNALHPGHESGVQAITDSRSLYEHLGSTKQPTNHRLRLEISALREMVDEGEIHVQLVEGAKQISDPLTKRGASDKLLREVLQHGQLPQ